MNYNIDFLKELDHLRLKVIYARIIILDFNSEEIIQAIEGRVTSGSISVSSTSKIRRSLNLQMITKPEYADIQNVDNLISINRKIKIEIGIGYKNDVVWFPQGIFIISSANTARSTGGWNISITGKDKMVLLNGTCGGMLTSVTRFDQKYIENEDGSITAKKTPIYQIVLETVNHLGHEPLENIIINDIPEFGQWTVKYSGSDPIYFANDYSTLTNNLAEAESWDVGYITKTKNEDIGYEETELIYPGELTLKAGDNVTTVLDKIVNQLGNFEYFYDIDGHFVFQQIKNYTNTASPWWELKADDYVNSYSNTKYQFLLTDQADITSITKTPNYENIKNDFIVWGARKSSTGIEQNICYRLVIDEKPKITVANKYWWKILLGETLVGYGCSEDIEHSSIMSYSQSESISSFSDSHYSYELIGNPCNEWREEMYRQAVAADFYGDTYSDYDAELLFYWRNIYDTLKWSSTNGWNPIVYSNPDSLVYWIDFIDDNAAINRFSVKTIGRRTKVENNNKVKALFYPNLPDVIFTSGEDQEAIQRYVASGQDYFITNDKYDALFTRSGTGVSAFDRIREMLYQNLVYNTTIQINCIPKYYLECNNIMYIKDINLAIDGNYCINSFTIPLTYNGTMSISLSEVLTRV